MLCNTAYGKGLKTDKGSCKQKRRVVCIPEPNLCNGGAGLGLVLATIDGLR